jgi:hypothetical protein
VQGDGSVCFASVTHGNNHVTDLTLGLARDECFVLRHPAEGAELAVWSEGLLLVGDVFLLPLADHLAFKLGERTHLVEEQLASWSGDIDAGV